MTTGQVVDGGARVDVPNFLVAGPPNGVALRVYVTNRLTITKAIAERVGSRDEVTGPALVLLAKGDIEITNLTAYGTAGGITLTGCDGHSASSEENVLAGGIPQGVASGGGGGGHATGGADGGDVINRLAGGLRGSMSGTQNLVPLRGGCAGGGLDAVLGGSGGGAIQLSSRTRILIKGNVDVQGGQGAYSMVGQNAYAWLGAGAGGGLLLEAPRVSLGSMAQLQAIGGNGNGCMPATTYCGSPGSGALPGVSATSGLSVQYTNSPSVTGISAGSGGGGVGRIRINTVDGIYSKSSTAIENGALSSGTLGTR